MGVGDHGPGPRDRRRVPRVDVVGRGSVVAAEGIGGDQLPAVQGPAAGRQLHAVDIPAIAGVVVAEQVERHLREERHIAAVATDHREGAVADADARLRLGQLDLAAVRAVPQPDRARPLVALGGRRTGEDDVPAVTRNRRIRAGLRFDGDRRPDGEAGGQTTLGRDLGDAERGKRTARSGCKQPATNNPSTRHRVPYNSRRRKPSLDARSAPGDTCQGRPTSRTQSDRQKLRRS